MRFSSKPPSPPQAPQTTLGRSPSAPNFSSLHPHNPAPTASAPSPRQESEREGKIAKIRAFFARKPNQQPPQHQASTTTMQGLASLAEGIEHSFLTSTDTQDDMSDTSTVVASAPSPLDHDDSDIGVAVGPAAAQDKQDHDAAQPLTSHAFLADLMQDTALQGTHPLEDEKLAALVNDTRTYDEHVVRKYRDLSEPEQTAGAGKLKSDSTSSRYLRVRATFTDSIRHRLGSAVGGNSADSTSQRAPEPIGVWQCCKCAKDQDLYLYDYGPHLVSVLNCDCPHRSCEDCTLTGGIKAYKPVFEPFPVQLDDKDQRVLFGIFCGECGSSWQAQSVSQLQDTVRQKITAVPKTIAKHGAHPLEKLRSSRSMSNLLGQPAPKEPPTPTPTPANKSTLNLRALSNEMEKEYGKQADSVMVNFSGIVCTCGCSLDTSALCFQIVDQPDKKVVEAPAAADKQASFTATPEDKVKGIETPTITLRPGGQRIRHANPLRSAPVTEEELASLFAQ